MKRIIKWALWILFGLAVVLTFTYLWRNGQTKEKSYQIIPVTTGDSIAQQLVLSGTVKPRDEVSIKPQIAGIISEVLVQAGQEVKVGDVIARISVVPEMQQINNAESNLEQARVTYERLASVHARDKELYDKGLLATEEYERSKAELANARIQLSSAEQALQITKSGVSSKYSKQSSTLVRATIAGKVLSVPVKVGSSVIQANNFNEGTTIATIANMNHLIFEGMADETEVGKLAVGQQMNITIGALQDIKLRAVVEYISPQGTTSSGSTLFEVRGALQGITASDITRLRAGYSANAEIVINKVTGVLSIPEACLSYRGDTTFVQLVKVEKPLSTEERVVTVGLSDGAKAEIKQGLKKGDKVRGGEVVAE